MVKWPQVGDLVFCQYGLKVVTDVIFRNPEDPPLLVVPEDGKAVLIQAKSVYSWWRSATNSVALEAGNG